MSFDTLAPLYRAMEFATAGGLLQHGRTAFLGATVSARRMLLVGEGPGRFLVELLRANATVEVTCVEASARMIAEAVRYLEGRRLPRERVAFEQCDARSWRSPRAAFDLIATHFFLDCFRRDELEGLVASLGRAATSEALWLVTDFRIPPAGWRRWRARTIIALLYAFFRAATGLSASELTSPEPWLEASGFRLAARRVMNFGLVLSDLWLRDPRTARSAPPCGNERSPRFSFSGDRAMARP